MLQVAAVKPSPQWAPIPDPWTQAPVGWLPHESTSNTMNNNNKRMKFLLIDHHLDLRRSLYWLQ